MKRVLREPSVSKVAVKFKNAHIFFQKGASMLYEKFRIFKKYIPKSPKNIRNWDHWLASRQKSFISFVTMPQISLPNMFHRGLSLSIMPLFIMNNLSLASERIITHERR